MVDQLVCAICGKPIPYRDVCWDKDDNGNAIPIHCEHNNEVETEDEDGS